MSISLSIYKTACETEKSNMQFALESMLNVNCIKHLPGFVHGFLFADKSCAIVNSDGTRIHFHQYWVDNPISAWLPWNPKILECQWTGTYRLSYRFWTGAWKGPETFASLKAARNYAKNLPVNHTWKIYDGTGRYIIDEGMTETHTTVGIGCWDRPVVVKGEA